MPLLDLFVISTRVGVVFAVGGAPLVMRSQELATIGLLASLLAVTGAFRLQPSAVWWSSGLGLAMLPCVLADVEAGLVRLTPEVLATRALSLVYRREMRLSAPVSAVIDFVFDIIRANAAAIEGTPNTARPSPDDPRRP